MKHLFTITVFLTIFLLKAYSQEVDSTKTRKNTPEMQIKDSLKADRIGLNIGPDYNRYGNDLIKTDDLLKFELNESHKNSNIFNSSYSKFIIPTGLISFGVLSRSNKSFLRLDQSTHNEISEHLKVSIPIDDYSQFAPIVAVYGLDIVGIKAKHNFVDRTIVSASSYIIMGAMVQTLKSTTNVWRPDGSNNNSFPSGHTATAFVGAHILFKEYKDVSPWIGVAGYAVATGTGALRVLNKKHWISDVVTGAGIGILSAETGYMLLPVFHKMFGIKDKNKDLVIVPSVSTNNYGVGLVYTF